jgi:hypothetical protein
MATEKFYGKIFDGTKDEEYKEKFKQYLIGLPNDNLPFNCSNLRVLSEDIKLINKGYPSETYSQGSLICLYAIPIEINPHCKIDSKIKYKKNNLLLRLFGYGKGKLEFTCLREGQIRVFKANLTDFKGK